MKRRDKFMTKIKKVLLGCAGAFIIAALPLAHAQAPGPDGTSARFHPGQRIEEIYSQLNLTDDQKTQLEAFQEELMKPHLDMPRINELHGQIKALLSQTEDTKLSSMLAVRAILTPEQFTKFFNLMHRHKQEHNE
jgi:Spy/CpxP family protein refolding chaperone